MFTSLMSIALKTGLEKIKTTSHHLYQIVVESGVVVACTVRAAESVRSRLKILSAADLYFGRTKARPLPQKAD